MLGLPLHPFLVHFPIAFLSIGALAAILFRLWPHQQGESWGVYSLLVGWLLTIPALITGLIDKSALPADSPANQLANTHTTGMIAMWAIFGLALYVYYLGRKRGGLSGYQQWAWYGLLVLGLVVLILAGHGGARLVYELGVGT